MRGDTVPAQAVALCTAAAVDHADTELIGHRGWEDTGFLCAGKQPHGGCFLLAEGSSGFRTGETKVNPVTQAPSPGRSWAIALRIGPNYFSKRTDAPILRRLWRHLRPMEGGYGSPSCSTGDTKPNPVTSCVPFRWQGNRIRREPKATENPVTRFPVGRREGSTKTRIQIRARQYCGPLRIRRQR